MFCTCVWQKSLKQELLEPQFVIHENEHILDCYKKVSAKFAHACNLGLSDKMYKNENREKSCGAQQEKKS